MDYNSRGLCMRKREGHAQEKGEVKATTEKCGMQDVSQKRESSSLRYNLLGIGVV